MASRKQQTFAPARLTPEQEKKIQAWRDKRHGWVSDTQLRRAIDDCLEWHQAKGTKWADWGLVCLRWIRTSIEDGKIQPPQVLEDAAKERAENERRERRRYTREVRQEFERLGPLGIAELVGKSKEERGF